MDRGPKTGPAERTLLYSFTGERLGSAIRNQHGNHENGIVLLLAYRLLLTNQSVVKGYNTRMTIHKHTGNPARLSQPAAPSL